MGSRDHERGTHTERQSSRTIETDKQGNRRKKETYNREIDEKERHTTEK